MTATAVRTPLDALLTQSGDQRRALARRFAGASPFPHLVVDDVLDAADVGLLEDFPEPAWSGWHRFTDEYQAVKSTLDDIDLIPGRLRELVLALNHPRFLTFLEEVTGVDGLVPDPYLKGGGLHLSGPGGVLAPHSDFHEYARLRLFRRVNVILYLNPGWQDDWGGALELYADADARELATRVPATWGRMVVFRTDMQSVHGFREPVPPGQHRRSVAMYYYTSAEADVYSGDSNTLWRAHSRGSLLECSQLRVYRGLLRASLGLSYAAHAFNPSIRQAAIRARGLGDGRGEPPG